MAHSHPPRVASSKAYCSVRLMADCSAALKSVGRSAVAEDC